MCLSNLITAMMALPVEMHDEIFHFEIPGI